MRVQDVWPLLLQPVEVLLQPDLWFITDFCPAPLVLARLTEPVAVVLNVVFGITLGADIEYLV